MGQRHEGSFGPVEPFRPRIGVQCRVCASALPGDGPPRSMRDDLCRGLPSNNSDRQHCPHEWKVSGAARNVRSIMTTIVAPLVSSPATSYGRC
jgi:hypothetical protein